MPRRKFARLTGTGGLRPKPAGGIFPITAEVGLAGKHSPTTNEMSPAGRGPQGQGNIAGTA